MKKIVLIFFILLSAMSAYSQVAWRVVAVSPNYPNVYPRYKTLQQVYNAIKDSANVTTNKYFIINIATATENVTDWGGAYSDSIVARLPYMRMTQLGQAIGDSIVGITPEEFNLIAGILSLDVSTAGNGLQFANHIYGVNVKYPVVITNDSVTVQLNDSNFVTGTATSRTQYVTLKRHTNSGINYDANGLFLLPRSPLFISTTGDTLYFYYNTNEFVATTPFGLKYKTNSGLNVDANGISVNGALPIVTNGDSIYLSTDTSMFEIDQANFWLTLNRAIAGDGLSWIGDSINITASEPLIVINDNIEFRYLFNHFDLISGSLYLKVDSGLIANTFPVPSTPKVSLDHLTLNFNTSGEVKVADGFAGDGLVIASNAIKIQPNEFALLQNDTLKIKTSYIKSFWGDSLTTNVTSIGTLPYDSTGFPVLYTGKIKRITYTFQLTSGNDTVITTTNNITVTVTQKVRCEWVNGSSQMRIRIWTQSTKSWANAITLDFTGFADNYWRIEAEFIAEAQ